MYRSATLARLVLCFIATCSGAILAQESGELNQWQVSLDQGDSFEAIHVPGAVEDQIDANFDGVSIYKTKLPTIQLAEHQRLLLHFQAVATEATVFVDGERAGEHLGGWTPFTVDITDQYRQSNPDRAANCWITVRVDELVGHNTQGFLPVITNHFGGIWQPVTWEIANSSAILANAISVRARFSEQQLVIATPFLRKRSDAVSLQYSIRPLQLNRDEPDGPWHPLEVVSSTVEPSDRIPIVSAEANDLHEVQSAVVNVPFPLKRWSPGQPQRYEIRIRMSLVGDSISSAKAMDQAQLKMGFRTFAADGAEFRLNEQPIVIRGLLNWGYAPPRFAPSLDEQWMRDEIQFARARGFNLMKFCLWIPPKRYLELCDELGMLTWIEYPTWHPRLDQQHLRDLRQEYAEFYEFDRNHCSIVLRSLTCETGPSADLEVVRASTNNANSLSRTRSWKTTAAGFNGIECTIFMTITRMEIITLGFRPCRV